MSSSSFRLEALLIIEDPISGSSLKHFLAYFYVPQSVLFLIIVLRLFLVGRGAFVEIKLSNYVEWEWISIRNLLLIIITLIGDFCD